MSHRADVRDYIIQNGVKRHRFVTYEELERAFHLSRGGNPSSRNRVGHVVAEISKYELSQHRPLLSAIVVHKSGADKELPGPGFLEIDGVNPGFSRKDGDKARLTPAEKAYIREEQTLVFAYPYA